MYVHFPTARFGAQTHKYTHTHTHRESERYNIYIYSVSDKKIETIMENNHGSGPDFLKKLLYLMGSLSLAACATGTHAWTLPTAFFGVYAVGETERKDSSALVPFIGFHASTIILDLIVIGNVAQYIVFGTVVAVFNLILKLFVAYVWHQYRLNYGSGVTGGFNSFMDAGNQQTPDSQYPPQQQPKGGNPPAPYANNQTSVPTPDYNDL